MTTISCPTCGTDVEETSTLCPTCGTTLADDTSADAGSPPPSTPPAGSPPPSASPAGSPPPSSPPPPPPGSPNAGGYGYAPAHPSGLEPDVRNWGMIAHVSAYAGLLGGVLFLVPPLIVYLLKREEHPFIEYHAKEALNFNISFTIYMVVAGIASFLLIGLPFLLALGVAWLILPAVAGIKASNGESYRYPLTIRFVS